MNKYIITGLAAILCGCTTYKNPGYSSYGTRVYSDDYDSGYYYRRAYPNGGYYDGGYNEREYGYGYPYRQHEVHTNVTVVHERDATSSRGTANHGSVSHGTSATVSHGHNGNKAAVGSSTKPAKVPSAGKHPRSDKTEEPKKQ